MLMAGDSRVSLVSFLKAKPQMAIALPATVLNRARITLPVGGRLWQPEVLAQINEIQDILLKTRPAETDRGPQELGANARVGSDGQSDLIDVRFGRFAKG